MKNFYVYILTNKHNRVIYTGVTNNLQRRIHEHKQKLITGFTQKYNLNKLVFFQEFSDIKDAIAAEKKIKGWLRIKKIRLIESINPHWEDLDPSFHSG